MTVGDLEDSCSVEDDGDGLEETSEASLTDMDEGEGTPWTRLGIEIVVEIAKHLGWTVDVTDSSVGGA